MGRKPNQANVPPEAALNAAISKANKAIEDLRTVTRDAHEAIQAAKEVNARMLRRLAEEFDSRAKEVIEARTEKMLAQLGKQLDEDARTVRRMWEQWDGQMSAKATYANGCIDVMSEWVSAFEHAADVFIREMEKNPYVQGVPRVTFERARATTRALFDHKPKVTG